MSDMFSGKGYYDVSTENSKLNLQRVYYGKRNSFFTFYLNDYSDGSYGDSRLYIGVSSWMAATNRRNRLFELHAVYQGEDVPYSVYADFSVIRIQSLFGYAELCIAEDDLLRMKGEGIRLALTVEPVGHESAKPAENGCFEVDLGNLNEKFLLIPIKGQLEVDAPYQYREFGVKSVRAEFVPDESSAQFEGAVLRFESNAKPVREFAAYEACVAAVNEDYLEWRKRLPKVPEKYEEMSRVAAYMIWSNVIRLRGKSSPEMICVDRSHNAAAYSWQQSYQAVAHSGDIKFAWKLLLSVFQYQDEAGQLPDSINDRVEAWQTCKAPIQGLAIDWIMRHCDLSSITEEEYEKLYEPLGRWTEWWFEYRDRNHDGLPAYDHGDESGSDDNTLFSRGIPVSAPDLAAFLALQMDVLSRLAEALGRKEESCRWKLRSEELIEKMIKTYWNGERFIARQGVDMENEVECDALQAYVPLILGQRLPEAVRSKMIEKLTEEGRFFTPYGLATEALDSRRLELSYAWTRGTVNAPNQFVMTIALDNCGEKELAMRVAKAYCDNIASYGPVQHFNPFTGKPMDSFGFFQTQFQPWTSWASCAFLVLAGYYL